MSDNGYRFHDLFAQLGLPNTPEAIAAFIARHRPLAGDVLLPDAPFWDAAQAEFLREKRAADAPEWAGLIDQLSEALRDDPVPGGSLHRPRLLGISGSLRMGSFNTTLLHAAQAAMAGVATLDIVTLHGIPLYDGDVEAREGLPAAVRALRERIHQADGLLFATPEYNNGIPGVFKNAIDWVSRTSAPHPDVLAGKLVAIMGASPGGFGTLSAQSHWLPVLRTLRMQHWSEGRLMVSKAHTVLHDGALTDPALAEALAAFVQGFGRFVARQAGRG